MQPDKHEIILDVGGTPDFWSNAGWPGKVICLNINISSKQRSSDKLFVVGDACHLPCRDNSIDLAFSNSCIEHVGGMKNAEKFASEIMRVGKRFWVQTPAPGFPVEPHAVFPFFNHFPRWLKKLVAVVWPFSFPKMNNAKNVVEELLNVELISEGQLNRMFQRPRIWRERIFFTTKSIVCYRGR